MYVYICLDLTDPFAFYSCSGNTFYTKDLPLFFHELYEQPYFFSFLSTKVRKGTFLSRRMCIQTALSCCISVLFFPRLFMHL